MANASTYTVLPFHKAWCLACDGEEIAVFGTVEEALAHVNSIAPALARKTGLSVRLEVQREPGGVSVTSTFQPTHAEDGEPDGAQPFRHRA